MKKNFALVAMAVLALGLSACDDKSKTTAETTDANGTTTESTVTTESSVDDDGEGKVETTKETTVDPKGLMNKQETETKTSTEVDH